MNYQETFDITRNIGGSMYLLTAKVLSYKQGKRVSVKEPCFLLPAQSGAG